MARSASFGHVDRDRVVIDCWLTIHPGDPKMFAHQRRPAVKVTAGPPKLGRNERAINLKMVLPLSLFETPSIVAQINVDSPVMPVTIDTSAVAAAVKSAIGMDIELRVVPTADAPISEA